MPRRLIVVQRISASELKRQLDAREPIAILDSRSADSWNKSNVQIPGSIRVPPDEVRAHLTNIPRDRMVVAYCT
jgi:rhodanese-related sulfurtransferase